MPFVAVRPEQYLGQTVGDGQCVAFVRAAANVPATVQWIEGELVWRTPNIRRGTAIATFNEAGRYANATDGSSHAAVFLETADDTGSIAVLDQWKLHPVSRRVIRSKAGKGPPCDDADAYSVLEVAE